MTSVDVDLVKQRNPIEEVLAAHGVALQRRGARFVACCPFHQEQHPSFVVYPDTRSFFCFGCRVAGDVIDFLRRKEGLGFREALEMLGAGPGHPGNSRTAGKDRAALPASNGARPALPSAPPRLTVDDRLILSAACELYHEALLRNDRGLRYLEGRGIEMALIRRCRLGYCDGQSLQPFLRKHRFSLRRAAEMGLLRKDGSEALAGRVVVPELRGGHCAWLVGRALDGSRLKYLGLSLPKPLLGYERVRGQRRIFLTEGPFDYLTGVSWNLPICALLGTHVRVERLGFLQRAREVVIVFDTDRAGRDAAAELAGSLGERARVVALPEGVKDLNDLGNRDGGRETFFRLLAASRDEKEDAHGTPS